MSDLRILKASKTKRNAKRSKRKINLFKGSKTKPSTYMRNKKKFKKKNAARRKIAEDQKEVLKLKIEGYSLSDIAGKMKISVANVTHAINEVFSELKGERKALGEHLLELELKKLDELEKKVWGKGVGHKEIGTILPSVNMILKIIEKRADFLGTNAPARATIDKKITIMKPKDLDDL